MQRNKKKEKVKKTTNRTLQEIVPVEVVPFEQGKYKIGKLHEIGNREGQQDAFAVSDISQTEEIRRNGLIAIVSDGMGGLQDGDKISSMVVLSLFQDFHNQKAGTEVSQLLLSMLANANETVNQFLCSRQVTHRAERICLNADRMDNIVDSLLDDHGISPGSRNLMWKAVCPL